MQKDAGGKFMKIILDFVTNSSESDYYNDYDCNDCDYDCDDDCYSDCDCDCDCYDYDCDDCWVPDGGPAPWDSCEADPDICCGYDH